MVPKLLIVDDDPDVRKIICNLLKAKYGAPLEASNGEEALALIEKKRPHLVLLDVMMPEMNGIDVLRAALEIDPTMIVIMLTSGIGIDIAKQCLEIGAKQYITKPFEAEDLRMEIERLLVKVEETEDKPPWRIKS